MIEHYAPLRKGHITTRQNIQLHHVPLPDAAKLIREICEAGLSSREGCGNTVRNVTGDPYAGVAADELFDPTPYAGAYVRYFVRHPTTQLMPRKLKTAFTPTDEDRRDHRHPRHRLHPARARRRPRASRSGSAAAPRSCPASRRRSTTSSRLDNGDYLKVTEAVLRIFDRQEWLRVNRARARIKVLIDKIGIDAFREMVDEELEGDWVAERDFDDRPPALRRRRGGQRAGAAAGRGLARTATAPSSTASAPRNVQAAAPGGLLARSR